MNEDAAPGSEPLPLDEAARRLLASAGALGGELGGAAAALRELALAELALSRSALVRALVLFAMALALATTAWLYAMATLTLALRALDFSWWAAAAIPALLSLLGTIGCAWLALRMLEDARFTRTRRVLARLRPSAADDAAAGGAP